MKVKLNLIKFNKTSYFIRITLHKKKKTCLIDK